MDAAGIVLTVYISGFVLLTILMTLGSQDVYPKHIWQWSLGALLWPLVGLCALAIGILKHFGPDRQARHAAAAARKRLNAIVQLRQAQARLQAAYAVAGESLDLDATSQINAVADLELARRECDEARVLLNAQMQRGSS